MVKPLFLDKNLFVFWLNFYSWKNQAMNTCILSNSQAWQTSNEKKEIDQIKKKVEVECMGLT